MVKLQAAQFSIQTSNLINTGLNDTGFHTGLENIRQRLLHTYADRATLSSGLTMRLNHYAQLEIIFVRSQGYALPKLLLFIMKIYVTMVQN